MDPTTLLQLLQRKDDEAAIYHAEVLEQFCDMLSRTQDPSILNQYPPSQFVPCLCYILMRPVHIFPEVPVLCCRCIFYMCSISNGRRIVDIVCKSGALGSYFQGLCFTNDEASKNLAEECIKGLEFFK